MRRKPRCAKCGTGIDTEEMYYTPAGRMCIVCMRIIARWVWNKSDDLRQEFKKFWPDE